ncbi:hypothetical protein PR048_001789 [Dryococelus australis]|uniref:Uncharacterized protein n=1 Tax=Dryococelus australis TaxID=614101 RepID=A0ABQ9IIB5_9NEOP|nr:hypothetical protein PR048_001789 [Dryococelus australis]
MYASCGEGHNTVVGIRKWTVQVDISSNTFNAHFTYSKAQSAYAGKTLQGIDLESDIVCDEFMFSLFAQEDAYKSLVRIKSKAQGEYGLIVKHIPKALGKDHFRPISILPSASKTLGHLIHKQVYMYVSEN